MAETLGWYKGDKQTEEELEDFERAMLKKAREADLDGFQATMSQYMGLVREKGLRIPSRALIELTNIRSYTSGYSTAIHFRLLSQKDISRLNSLGYFEHNS